MEQSPKSYEILLSLVKKPNINQYSNLVADILNKRYSSSSKLVSDYFKLISVLMANQQVFLDKEDFLKESLRLLVHFSTQPELKDYFNLVKNGVKTKLREKFNKDLSLKEYLKLVSQTRVVEESFLDITQISEVKQKLDDTEVAGIDKLVEYLDNSQLSDCKEDYLEIVEAKKNYILKLLVCFEKIVEAIDNTTEHSTLVNKLYYNTIFRSEKFRHFLQKTVNMRSIKPAYFNSDFLKGSSSQLKTIFSNNQEILKKHEKKMNRLVTKVVEEVTAVVRKTIEEAKITAESKEGSTNPKGEKPFIDMEVDSENKFFKPCMKISENTVVYDSIFINILSKMTLIHVFKDVCKLIHSNLEKLDSVETISTLKSERYILLKYRNVASSKDISSTRYAVHIYLGFNDRCKLDYDMLSTICNKSPLVEDIFVAVFHWARNLDLLLELGDMTKRDSRALDKGSLCQIILFYLTTSRLASPKKVSDKQNKITKNVLTQDRNILHRVIFETKYPVVNNNKRIRRIDNYFLEFLGILYKMFREVDKHAGVYVDCLNGVFLRKGIKGERRHLTLMGTRSVVFDRRDNMSEELANRMRSESNNQAKFKVDPTKTKRVANSEIEGSNLEKLKEKIDTTVFYLHNQTINKLFI